MIPSTAQATLTNILLSGVPTYGHTAPSPPPGLTPVDVHINSMQTEGKNISASINGHVQVIPPCDIQGGEGSGRGLCAFGKREAT